MACFEFIPRSSGWGIRVPYVEFRGQQAGVALCSFDLAAVYVNAGVAIGSICMIQLLSLQLSAMDVSAWTTMKGAAKCDNLCELQNSVNQ